MEQVDFTHRGENLSSPPVPSPRLQYNTSSAALKRGGVGDAGGNRVHLRTRNTHQFKKKKDSTALTWSPPNWSFLATAETDFAENPQEMPLA